MIKKKSDIPTYVSVSLAPNCGYLSDPIRAKMVPQITAWWTKPKTHSHQTVHAHWSPNRPIPTITSIFNFTRPIILLSCRHRLRERERSRWSLFNPHWSQSQYGKFNFKRTDREERVKDEALFAISVDLICSPYEFSIPEVRALLL